MGLFDTNSPFDADVEKATNENNTAEDWGIIMEICDKVGNSSSNAKECLKSITKRLQSPDPHVALQAITLLDACVNNCGKMFQLEVASRDFESVLRKLLVGTGRSSSQNKVVEKIRSVVKNWAEWDFKTDPQLGLIPALYHKLRQEGVDFSAATPQTNPKTDIMTTDPDAVTNQQEVDDIAKAIALSLTDSNARAATSSSTPKASTSLYPSVSSTAPSYKFKVRALYDFEAAEDNELTFFTGEIINVTDDSDANWWKGTNQRGEGLFPANFVTTDLTTKAEKKTVQFSETVEVKKIKAPELVVIDESKIDRVLNLLHEADPNDGIDSEELLALEDEVYKMAPLIDTELEKVDRKGNDLAVVGSSLVDSINMYHSLMHEPGPPQFKPSFPPPHLYNGYPHFTPGGYVPAPMDQPQPPAPHQMNGAMYSLGGSPHHMTPPAPTHLPGAPAPPPHVPQPQPPQ